MVSIGGDFANQAMWLYPKNLGFITSERWGHSACHSHGLVYIYGGCCGGLHFNDVLVLNLNTMSFIALATKGNGPCSRDSHSAVLWGSKMIIFGGTDGSKKLNDLHLLDLESNEWIQPHFFGNPPSPRESHTAILVGDDKLVVFGGSGEGIGNYLNDLHFLDLKSMTWSSIDGLVKGDSPSPRDSHAVAVVGDELFVFGGDSGDQCHGDVHRFDTKSMTWIKLAVFGSSPGARAGHVAVTIGHKIYVLGGVGDKKYYNDVWIFDTIASSWSKLDTYGLSPQGRFSHTAVVVGYDIVIYGGCGEDERPLREFLILRLRNNNPIEWHNISSYKGNENGSKMMHLGDVNEAKTTRERLEMHYSKRRRSTIDTNTSNTIQSEPEEHSLSVSQHSSQSQSDQEQTTVRTPQAKSFPFFYSPSQIPNDKHTNIATGSEKPIRGKPHPSLIGADVRGKVDGAFDSGYLMTALINGRVFRGVLFAPDESFMCTTREQVSRVVHIRGGNLPQNMTPTKRFEDSEMGQPSSSFREIASVKREAMRRRMEFEGVVLSLGVPGNGD